MADLEELMALNGALAAFRYSSTGEVLEQSVREGADFDARVLDLVAHMCVANLAIATLQARGWEAMTGMTGFHPVQQFGLLGLDWTVVVDGERGVILPTGQADLDGACARLGSGA